MVQQSLLLYVSRLISPNQVSWRLLGNMKHDTSSIILYMCLAISARSIWPPLSPDTRIPFLRPGAFFFSLPLLLLLLLLRGNRFNIRSSSSEEWGDDDEQSQPEQTFCLNFWQDIQQLTVSAFVGPIANSCKLTIWRQQLWAMKGLKIKRREHLRGRKNTWSLLQREGEGEMTKTCHRWMCPKHDLIWNRTLWTDDCMAMRA